MQQNACRDTQPSPSLSNTKPPRVEETSSLAPRSKPQCTLQPLNSFGILRKHLHLTTDIIFLRTIPAFKAATAAAATIVRPHSVGNFRRRTLFPASSNTYSQTRRFGTGDEVRAGLVLKPAVKRVPFVASVAGRSANGLLLSRPTVQNGCLRSAVPSVL